MRQHRTFLARRACERSVRRLGPGVPFPACSHRADLLATGGRHASSANLATPAQQIAVAQDVLASQDISAWPVCGARG
jgi:Transglycosylase-like domain